MYLLFREFHWKPSDYYDMPEGEKIVTRAFLAKFADEKEKESKELEKIKRRK